MSKAIVFSAGTVIAVVAVLLWSGFIVIERVRGAGSQTPQPPPPSDRVEGVPAPDNTIVDSPSRSAGGRP